MENLSSDHFEGLTTEKAIGAFKQIYHLMDEALNYDGKIKYPKTLNGHPCVFRILMGRSAGYFLKIAWIKYAPKELRLKALHENCEYTMAHDWANENPEIIEPVCRALIEFYEHHGFNALTDAYLPEITTKDLDRILSHITHGEG